MLEPRTNVGTRMRLNEKHTASETCITQHKNGQVLQEGANIGTVVFDKTGTLTQGKLYVSAAAIQIDES